MANAAEKGDWVDVRRLLLAGPGLSLPLVRVSRIDILNVVLGLVEHRSEGHCQRGGNTSTAISTHYWSPATCPFPLLVGHSPLTPPPGIDVGTVLWGFSWPARKALHPIAPPPGADVHEEDDAGLWLSALSGDQASLRRQWPIGGRVLRLHGPPERLRAWGSGGSGPGATRQRPPWEGLLHFPCPTKTLTTVSETGGRTNAKGFKWTQVMVRGQVRN